MRTKNKMEKQNKINTPKKETTFLLKFILLLLSVSFLINSCKNEEFLDENETGKQSINSKKIPFDNSIHFPTINKNITKINAQLKKINNQKNSDNSTVEILTDEVLFTSYANTHTYTFILIRDNPEYWLENVVLHYNTETNNYNEYLIQYSFGENELLDISNGELFENSEYVNVISLENGFFNQNQKSGCDWTSETVWSDCGSGVHNQSNIGEWHNCTANPPPSAYQQWSMTCTSTNETIDAGPSSGGGGNTSGGGSNDSVVSNPLTNPPCTIGQGDLGIADSNGGCVKPREVLDFDEQIFVDDAFKDNPCLKSVYDGMGKATTFNNYLMNFESDFSTAHLKFSTSNTLPDNTNAETSAPQNYLITITFNENNLDRPQLSVARTFIHELIHAEIFKKLLSVAQHPSIQLNQNQIIQLRNDYPGLYDYYTRWKWDVPQGQSPSSPQHEAMAQHYRDIIKQALKEFDNSQTEEVYNALSWTGLQNTVAWNNLTQIERDNINQAITNFNSNNPNCQ